MREPLQARYQALADFRPWDVLPTLAKGLDPLFAWSDPRQEMTFVAQGKLRVYRHPTCDDLAAVKHWCSSQSEQILSGIPLKVGALPLFIGALPFNPNTSTLNETPWLRGPARELWVPRIIWFSNAEGSGVITLDGSAPPAPPMMAREQQLGFVRGAPPRLTDTQEERQSWCGKVKGLLEELSRDDSALNKVVLARQTSLQAPSGFEFDPLATVQALRGAQPSATVFWYRDGAECAFIGATPELLIGRRGEALHTVALAGTRPRGDTLEEDRKLEETLRRSEKEQLEHQLVVEAICEALSDLGGDVVREAYPHVRKLAHVQHLETEIRAHSQRDTHLLDYVHALHPTPAVGGVPRALAIPWLAAHEGIERGAYAAPIGWFDAQGDGTFYVALRSALLSAERAWAFAGAGVVAGSEPEHEWREVTQKLETISSALCTRRARE